jgi:hypothetical protein
LGGGSFLFPPPKMKNKGDKGLRRKKEKRNEKNKAKV